jgi:hypothetical protein
MRAGRGEGGVEEVREACEGLQKGADREGSMALSRCVDEKMASVAGMKLLLGRFDQEVVSVTRGRLAEVRFCICWEGC